MESALGFSYLFLDHLYLGCEDFGCSRSVSFTAKELQSLLGVQATFADVERRMKCSHCGRLIAGLRIVSHVGCP